MAFMNVRMMMLVLLAVAAAVAKPAVAQLPGLPGGDGVYVLFIQSEEKHSCV